MMTMMIGTINALRYPRKAYSQTGKELLRFEGVLDVSGGDMEL